MKTTIKKSYLIITTILCVMMCCVLVACGGDEVVEPTTVTLPTDSSTQHDTFIVATTNETQLTEATENPTETDKVVIRENATISRNSQSNSPTTQPIQSSNANPAQASQSNKVWHNAVYKSVEHPAETKKVWIVDKDAYTYDKPVYKNMEIHICDICKLDITGTEIEHQEQHTQDVTYYTEFRNVVVDYETVTVPEQGHYEEVVIKEAYIDYVLIKEAGYY